MKKLSIGLVCILLLVSLSSCAVDPNTYPPTPTKWVVIEIRMYRAGKGTCLYKVEPVACSNIVGHTMVVDSIGKFLTGDTLSLQTLKRGPSDGNM